MKTTRKQLVNFAIGLVKKTSKYNSIYCVRYETSRINIILYKDLLKNDYEIICIDLKDDLKTNKAKFKKAILKIGGIVL